MPTRNFYVNISRRLQYFGRSLMFLGLTVWLGGYILIAVLSKVTGNPEVVVGVGGRVWFSACIVIGVLFLATNWFNPDRDVADRPPRESWFVIILNLMLMMAIYSWFIE